MSGEVGPEQQLSQIQEMISETRSTYTGGGIIAMVFGLLTAVAFAVIALRLVPNTWVVWAVHNCLGWAFAPGRGSCR